MKVALSCILNLAFYFGSRLFFFFQLVQMLSEAKRANKMTIQSSPDYIIFSKE